MADLSTPENLGQYLEGLHALLLERQQPAWGLPAHPHKHVVSGFASSEPLGPVTLEKIGSTWIFHLPRRGTWRAQTGVGTPTEFTLLRAGSGPRMESASSWSQSLEGEMVSILAGNEQAYPGDAQLGAYDTLRNGWYQKAGRQQEMFVRLPRSAQFDTLCLRKLAQRAHLPSSSCESLLIARERSVHTATGLLTPNSMLFSFGSDEYRVEMGNHPVSSFFTVVDGPTTPTAEPLEALRQHYQSLIATQPPSQHQTLTSNLEQVWLEVQDEVYLDLLPQEQREKELRAREISKQPLSLPSDLSHPASPGLTR